MGGAVLHASWNAIIRLGRDKVQGMLLLSVSQGLMGVAMAASLPLPHGITWLWLAASAVFHSAYKIFLTFAYERGDLSRVYPIARGTAPMIVAVVGAFMLPDLMANRDYLGIALVGLGIILMARGVFTNGEAGLCCRLLLRPLWLPPGILWSMGWARGWQGMPHCLWRGCFCWTVRFF